MGWSVSLGHWLPSQPLQSLLVRLSRFGRQSGFPPSENTSTSSPVTVEMSWCTLTSGTPVASWTIIASRVLAIATMCPRTCLSKLRTLP